jgi:hypothetical protein
MRTSRVKSCAFHLPLVAGVALAFGVAAFSTPASAQGFFSALFDALSGRQQPMRQAPTAYGEPGQDGGPAADQRPRVAMSGPAFCVRLCDGRYFPLPRTANATPVQLCNSFCPATKTKVLYGSTIEGSVGADGVRYTGLENALLYRKQFVPSCSCNGKDALGLAHIDIASDPTLRPGDIVATANGLMAYSPRGRGDHLADFTPVEAAKLPGETRSRIADIEVTKPN